VPWFKVDDQLATHPKVARAGLAAMGLWVKAGSWSAQHLTDGHIPAGTLRILGATRAHADALVKAGLWIADSDGWRFRDWFDYQPISSDVKAHREERSHSGKRGNHTRWHVRYGRRNPDCEYCQEAE
jgi:hypothetical protein